jgi:IS5 family transposase
MMAGFPVFEPAIFAILRHAFQAQPNLHVTLIEKIRPPLQSPAELPPILAGLQWVWMQPTLKAEPLALLEAKILAGKQATGRTGMDLWQILVLGVVRLGLDADWDRMEHIANYDLLVRQMLGLPAAPWGEEDKRFGYQTLRDNVALLDEELRQQINAAIAAAGRKVFAKKSGAPLVALKVKVDTYVLESEIHSLEHHGLNRCPDVGLAGCLRYVGYGVMSYNLHVIGQELLRRQRARGQPLALAA